MLAEDARIVICGFIIVNTRDNTAWLLKLKLWDQTKLGLTPDATRTNFVSQLFSLLRLTSLIDKMQVIMAPASEGHYEYWIK